ncbi:MAG: Tim44/TimA family putative adaptor protein [Asticcacaulis sp.]
MNNNVIALIVFAVLALVILVNLYNVLGRKTGFRVEDKTNAPKPDREADTGVRVERAVEGARITNLDVLKTRDANFNEINFLEKARETYEQIVIAFHKGELDPVKDKLAQNVLSSFNQAVEQRPPLPESTLSFVDSPKADFDLIELKGDVAQIRVRFLSELVYEAKDAPPVVAEAEPEAEAPKKKTATKAKTPKLATKSSKEPAILPPARTYKRTAEYWTFQKGVTSPNNPWLLTRVEAAKA